MNVTMRFRGVSSSAELTDFVLQRSARALGRFDVRDVHITLEDVNGPRGGKDKQCKLRVRFGTAEVVLVCLGFSEFAVVEEAFSRLREQVARLHGRRQAFDRRALMGLA